MADAIVELLNDNLLEGRKKHPSAVPRTVAAADSTGLDRSPSFQLPSRRRRRRGCW